MTRLALALLGQMQVMVNGQPILNFPYEKVRALFAYLAIESSYPHHRDSLAALLWSDRCESNARSNLRKALCTLRHLLGDSTVHSPLFLTTRNTIQFNPAGEHTSDVAILTQLHARRSYPALNRASEHSHAGGELDRECVSDLEQAVGLYRGAFLDRIQLPDSEAFEAWVMLNRQRFHEFVVNACMALVTHYEHQHNYQKAQHYAQRQLELEPWNESAHQCLMRILAQCGRRTAALKQYDRCCQILEQELATEPEPATIALWEAIRSGTFPDRASADCDRVKLLSMSAVSVRSIREPLAVVGQCGRPT
ncbi:BTAD domain-containing putative transcriptional regulator [Microcoleus sp. bin48.metabat.b7b8b9.023]|uniref:AfsR/SARP family transcriptional regulator n=1 Tax=Microcoleus sp. bin48.metabat.b7b8b9.023 TaxID=2742710 RepID=UPI0025D654A6|nr:BTAD domain-containing putative transcriptional regulator [Microcoleus sp. bin48.metabat.b7b8b9.023]